jgi:hypothetical protein
MSMRVFGFSNVAAVSIVGAALGLGATPAAACGYNGCGGGVAYAAVPVVVEPVVPAYAYSGCGCGGGYYPAYTYPSAYGAFVDEGVGPSYYPPVAYGPRFYGRRYGGRY